MNEYRNCENCVTGGYTKYFTAIFNSVCFNCDITIYCK